MSKKQTTDKQRESKQAEEWLAEHAADLPADELQPIRARELRDGDNSANHERAERLIIERIDGGDEAEAEADEDGAAAAPARVSKKDAPQFDEEIGRIPEWELPDTSKPDERSNLEIERELQRWGELAERVSARLKELAATVPDAIAPVREGNREAAAQWHVHVAPGLAALEELNRVLWPHGWRSILRDWFEQRALARVEARQRELPSRRAQPFALPPRDLPNASLMLEILQRNPPNLMGEIPAGLTPEILESLAPHVVRGAGGRNGGWTPETAVLLAEKCASDPAELRRVIESRTRRKQARGKATPKRGN